MSQDKTVVQIQNPDVNPSLLSKVMVDKNTPPPAPPKPVVKLAEKK